MKQKQNMNTPKEQSNLWKRATFILAILLVVSIGWNFYSDWKIKIDYMSPEGMCSRIRATPTWIDVDGNIIGEGVQMFNESVSEKITSYFINNSIYLIYSSGCSACVKQIEIFGDDWDRYKNSGLAIDCNDVFKNG